MTAREVGTPVRRDADAAPWRGRVVLIAAGLLATGLGWPGLIGELPFTLLFKNQLGLGAEQVAAFWGVTTFGYYAKPLVGLVCDAYPLLGTRRRGYLLAGSAAAAALWLAFAFVPRTYLAFMVVMTALNVAMVFVSAAVGGLLVETAQRHGATGRLSALRVGLVGVMSLCAGPVGGWLAGRRFGWTPATGALIVLSFVPVAAWLCREPRGARADAAVFPAARARLREIVRSRAMWAAAGLLLLVYLAPGFQTPLLYYQQDVLSFDAGFMGTLRLVGGAGALVGSAAYAVLCRRLPLRVSLIAGIAVNAASTLLYLAYTSRASAVAITATAAVMGTLAVLPLYDLAARATPRGSESFGYAILMSVQAIAVFAVSNVIGSFLYGRLHMEFRSLVWVNAASTAAVLFFVALLPASLLARREEAGSSNLQ
jgi:Na+/melibiose symporter-like transporter